MPEVQSSAIRRIEHDPMTQFMDVWFVSGGPYRFAGVPRAVYESFISASSVGTYYDRHIRDRYQYRGF